MIDTNTSIEGAKLNAAQKIMRYALGAGGGRGARRQTFLYQITAENQWGQRVGLGPKMSHRVALEGMFQVLDMGIKTGHEQMYRDARIDQIEVK